MTDARFPEAWLNDRRIVRLSDKAFRLFVTTLAWSASNRTDGLLEVEDLDLLHGVDADKHTELVQAGLWRASPAGFLILDFDKTQSTRAQLEGLDQKRALDRERKARQRARDRGQPDPGPDGGEGMSRVTSTVTSDVTQRQGQDRTGKASTEGPTSRSDPRFWKQPDEMDGSVDVDAHCDVCGFPLNGALACAGETTHPGCAA